MMPRVLLVGAWMPCMDHTMCCLSVNRYGEMERKGKRKKKCLS
jgi:hypothetical protein